MASSVRHTVGLRELKNRLSEYVRLVRAGGQVQVTDRGHVVAELLPPGVGADHARHHGLAALARRGMIVPGAPNCEDVYPATPPTRKPGRAARLLDAVRGNR
ncbi:MAG TPA: type II toxin-antitoxin system prevent-host-death family antitoxin [Methylomirabilota bacterium]|nr:type II toxin-antitoxin system prevent-host-death family antitoxin [Methylomirabilota bacterium]